MSPVAIVAIPRKDDYVWNISSEKVPHMTLLVLGEPSWDEAQTNHVTEYMEHAASLVQRFGMGVDRRGELGPDDGPKADVLFFDKGWNRMAAEQLRSNLLADHIIKTAYDSQPQFDSWVPHLTLGWPDKPAKKDDRDYPGTTWVQFDKIALWTSDFSGPTYELKSEFGDYGGDIAAMGDFPVSSLEETLAHFGVKGMKWGVRRKRSRQTSPDSEDTARVSSVKKGVKTQKTTRHLSNAQLEDAIKRMRLEQEFSRLSGGLDKTKKQKAASFVKKVLTDTGQQVAKETVKTQASAAVNEQLKKKAA